MHVFEDIRVSKDAIIILWEFQIYLGIWFLWFQLNYFKNLSSLHISFIFPQIAQLQLQS